MEANNIDEVIQGLDTIIESSKQTNSRVGFFAALPTKLLSSSRLFSLLSIAKLPFSDAS